MPPSIEIGFLPLPVDPSQMAMARSLRSTSITPASSLQRSRSALFTRQPELAAKQVEIMKETFPNRSRLAALWDNLSADQLGGAERAAKSLHLTLRALKLENPPYDIAAAFRRVAEGDPQMLLVLSSPLFGPHNKELAQAALRSRLPAMF